MTTVHQHLAGQILLADRLVNSAKEIQPSKFDCSDVVLLAGKLSHLLRSAARLLSGASLYDRPFRAVLVNVAGNLHRAHTLVCKCKQRRGVLRQLFAITTVADVRKVSTRLESSIADVKWLLSIFISDDNSDDNAGNNTGVNLTLPPIASYDPILAWVWSNIAAVHHSTSLNHRIDAANSLASLARDNDRNKKIIIEEDGIPALLKLLKEPTLPEAQIAGVSALCNLASDQEKVTAFIKPQVVPTIFKVLNDSTTTIVRTNVIHLVSKMAERDQWVQQEFGKENVTRLIITFLANDMILDDVNKPESVNSLVQITEIAKNSNSNNGSFHNRKERDISTSPEEKMKLKITCARALSILAKGCLLNSRKITETKALICLAKIIENQNGELQVNCLMTVMELALVAESNPDLRRQAFKPNSPAARAVLDQVLRVVHQETNPKLVVPAIKSIGSLARTFPAKETRIIGPLVAILDDKVSHVAIDIATEAVIALAKFVCPENFNCFEHSKAVLEFDGVRSLMSFLKNNDDFKIRVHGLKLLCYLSLHVGNSKALVEAQALSVIEGAARSVVTQCPDLKELFVKAIHHLNLYQAGIHTHKPAYEP